MKLHDIVGKDLIGLVVLPLYQCDYLIIHLLKGLIRAAQARISSQVLIAPLLQCHHVKILTHAVKGYHGPRKLCGLLYVVGSTRSDALEYKLLRCTSSGQGSYLVFKLLLTHEIMVALFIHLHGIAESSRSPGHYGYLMYWCGVVLLCRHHGMSDLMIGNYELFLVRKDLVLLLVSGKHHLDALLQILLGHPFPACLDGTDGSLIYHIGKLCSGSSGTGLGDGLKVDVAHHLDVLGMYLEYVHTSLHIGKLNGHTPVETTGAQECRIKGIRLVGGSKDYDALCTVKSIHLRKQLVEGLLPLIVASEGSVSSLLSDGIYLIYENDAGSLFLGLLEQIPDLCRTHAHIQLNELRSRHGKEGYVGLSCNCLCKEGLTGSGRTHKQCSLGYRGPYSLILLRVVQEIHHVLKKLLGLILTCHITEGDSGFILFIDLGIGLSKASEHAASGSH